MSNTLSELLAPAQPENLYPPSHPEWLKTQFHTARRWIEAQISESLAQAWEAQEAALEGQADVTASLQRLFDAATHACLLGGKRVRPLLVLMVGEALGGQEARTLKGLVIATELIHAQSLVFDDLPCMDDDALRRGQPTTHVAYDEATAVLVGDALACHAYEALVAATPMDAVTPQALLNVVKALGGVGSFNGLVNGQYADMMSAQSAPSLAHLRYIHANKTGALLRFAVMSPAWLSAAPPQICDPLDAWSRHMGQLFQVVDDVLDATQPSEQLGKTAGKDAEQNKLTYVSLLGLEGAQAEIHRLNSAATQALDTLEKEGLHVSRLRDVQTFFTCRTT